MGCHTPFPNKEKMASLFFIKNVQLAIRKGHAAEEQKQIWTSSTWIKHTGSVYMKCYSRDKLIQFIIFYFGCEE